MGDAVDFVVTVRVSVVVGTRIPNAKDGSRGGSCRSGARWVVSRPSGRGVVCRQRIVVYRVSAQRAGEEPYAAIVSSTSVAMGGGCWRSTSSRLPDPDREDGVTLMVAVPASRSMPIGAPPLCDGLTTSIFCRSRSSRTQLRASEIARRRTEPGWRRSASLGARSEQ